MAIRETKSEIILESKYASITVSKGDSTVTSVEFQGKEIASEEQVHFFSFFDNEKKESFPTSLELKGDVIAVKGELGSFDVRVECGDCFFLEVLTALPETVYKVFVGRAKYTEPVAVNVAMTIGSIPKYYPDAKSCETLFHTTRRLSDEGAKCALLIAPPELHRDMLKDICLQIDKAKGIFNPLGGVFAQDNKINYSNYMISTNIRREAMDANIEKYAVIGIDHLDIHQGYNTFRQGDMKYMSYNDDAEFRKYVGEPLAEKGIGVSLHTYSFYVDYNCEPILSKPEYQKDLRVLNYLTLSEDIDAETSLINTAEPSNVVTVGYTFFSKSSPFILIDEELIQFNNTDNGFRVVRRGAAGTKAVPHKKGAVVKHIEGYYSGLCPQLGSNLFFRIARNTAERYNKGGFEMIYLDALDGVWKNIDDREEYVYYGAAFIKEVLQYCERPPIIEFSFMEPAFWAGRGRLGAWDSCNVGYKQFNKAHEKSNRQFLDRYATCTLGWYNYYSDAGNNTVTRYQHRDVMDHMGTIALVNNFSTAFQSRTTTDLGRVAGMRRNLAIYKKYDDLRKSDYFSPEYLAKIDTDNCEYALTEEKGRYYLQERNYCFRRIRNMADSNMNNAVFTNPFSKQKPFIRIEMAMGADKNMPFFLLAGNEKTGKELVEFETKYEKPLDLSEYPGRYVRVKGNGKKGVIIIRMWGRASGEGGVAKYIIDTDFEGWREFVMVEDNSIERDDLQANGNDHWRLIYANGFVAKETHTVGIQLSGDTEGVVISDVYAVPEVYDVIKNPTVEVNGQSIMFECEVPSAEFIEFDGERAVVIDRHGNEKPVWFSGELTVPKGNFKAKLTGRSLNRLIPGAMLTFGFKGKTIK